MRIRLSLLVLLVGACSPEPQQATSSDAGVGEPLPFAPSGPNAAPDPSTTGPYPVGVRTITLVDPSRMTPGHTTPRKLVCEVWYPAVEAARGQPGVAYDLHDALPDDMKPTIPAEALGVLQTDAVQDAEPRHDGRPFPLVIFSHGKGGIRMQSTFYTVALASHGYVVVAPDHEGDTLPDTLREGELNINTTVDSFVDRPQDVMFLLDHFEALPSGDFLSGLIDMDRVGVSGHSFGAITSFRAAGMDYRIKAVVAQTPAGYTLMQVDVGTPMEQWGIPLMIQSADLDRTLPVDPHSLSTWEHMVSPRFFLRLATGGHFTYSDLCILDVEAIDAALEIDVSNVLTDGCGEENVSPEVAFPVIRHYGIGLFNTYLRDSPGTGALLTAAEGTRLGGAEVSFIGEP
ncbi:MAG: hypothetical protein AB2A00_31290 [Myxococcota bacterium]